MDEISTDSPAQSMAGGSLQIVLRAKEPQPGLAPEFVIDHFPATIGRHPVNDIELLFDSVSRYHARIELRRGHLYLVDLRSSNGTFINGQRVQMAPLNDQDNITIGTLEFSVSILAGDAVRRKIPGDDTSSVQFLVHDERGLTVFRAEMPDDSTHSQMLEDEITDAARLRKAKDRLISLYRLQDVLRSTTDEEKLLRGVLALLFNVLPVDRGVFLVCDEQDPSVFRPVAIKVKPGVEHDKIGISRTILQRCLRERVALLTRDASNDQRFSAADSVVASNMRSVLCVPLISARNVFGFCHLDTTDAIRSFTEEDLTYLAHVGQEVAIHLHNLRMLHEKILQERMAAIGQTITGMAHNIKNILVLMQGGIEILEKRLRERSYDAIEDAWGVVRRGQDRINRLVQDMLDYSRSRTVEKRRVDVADFLHQLSETFKDEMAKRRITFTLKSPEGLPPLMLDVDGLDKALVNLIVNAMEACNEGAGRITLSGRLVEERLLVLEVEDTAGGIPPEVLPRIFVPFFTTKGSKGSGLGLAMTRKIIEDMGGTIEVRSTEGKGTCFIIRLPVGSGRPAKPAPPGESPA